MGCKIIGDIKLKRKGKELEKLIAKELNGYLTANSGAVFWNGDVVTNKFTIECKQWNTDSFSIKYDVWQKIKGEANKDRKEALYVTQNMSKEILVTMSLDTLKGLL